MTTIDYYLQDVWKKTIDQVVETANLSDQQLIYFKSRLLSIKDNKATVVVPVFINKSILSANKAILEETLSNIIENKVVIEIIEEGEIKNSNFLPSGGVLINEYLTKNIDENQTFDMFVRGRSNIQAHAASFACANNPGLAYNPLFIYGNSGLGKTHLLNAIGNQFKMIFTNKQIGYISGLEFVEGVYKASEAKKLDEFKEMFKSLDLLLVDDIQFIAGKPKTHEIFFSIFNELVNNKKQICITADRTPSEIKDLEDRIISRFNQGLTVNIEAPEYETSINILKLKIQNNPLISQSVDDEVLNYLATNFSQDVRSLEGAVNRLLFYAINFPIEGEEDRISLKLAVEAFNGQIKENKNELTISSVRRAVCDYYNLTKQQITSAARTKNIADARHIAMYLCRKLIDAPFQEIGSEFGKRDHTTVMSACEKVEKMIKSNPLYLKAINEIEAKLK